MSAWRPAIVVLGAEVSTSAGGLRATADRLERGEPALRALPWLDLQQEPFVGGFVEDDALPPLHRKVQRVVRGTTLARIVRLAGQALAGLPRAPTLAPPALVLGIDGAAQLDELSTATLLDELMRQAQVRLDLARSEVLCAGRLAGALALERARQRLLAREDEVVLVGGVDCMFDLPRLLDRAFARAWQDDPPEDPPPGEAAALLSLARAEVPGKPLAGLAAHALAAEPELAGLRALSTAAQRLSSQPGGSTAPHAVVASLAAPADASEAAHTALQQLLPRVAVAARPCWTTPILGDAGAASGPLAVALAADRVARDPKSAPALAWCADASLRSALTCLVRASGEEVVE